MSMSLDQFDTDCDLALARVENPAACQRDPRVDPMPGDVLRKWRCNFTVTFSAMGVVELNPPWKKGILAFQEWAKDAEVIHVDPAMPPKEVAVPDHCND